MELNIPVPSLSVIQYSDDGEPVTIAFAENASSVSTDALDASQGMADIIMTWELSEGTLVSTWSVWEDSTFDFLQCQYVAQDKSVQSAPYINESHVMELDQRLLVLSDTYLLSNATDSCSILLEYDASGTVAARTYEWISGNDGTWFSVRILNDQTLSAVSCNSGTTDFSAVSEPVESYLDGDSLVLEAVDYDPSFLSAVSERYPGIPVPRMDDESESLPATQTDVSADIHGTIWCLCFGSDENKTVRPFITADSLLVIQDGRIQLNTNAKDLNGNAPAFAEMTFDLPSFEQPVAR